MGERRRYERRRPSHYSAVFDRDSQKLLGRLANLSTEGLMLISEEALPLHQNFQCRIMLPEDLNAGPSICFKARSHWCRKGTTPQTYHTGLSFTDIRLKDLEVLEELTRHPAFQTES